MTDEKSENVKATPQNNPQNTRQQTKSSTGKTCCIIAVIVILVIVLFIGSFFLRYWIGLKFYNQSSNSTSESYGGNWRLDMTDSTTTTGPVTSIDTSGSGTLTFTMPSNEGGKFESSGEWNSEGSGTVGPSSTSSTIAGKVHVAGEIKSDKLHLTISYTEESCKTTLTTPLGSSVSEGCDPGTLPDPHDIDLEIRDGAATTSDVTTDKNGYKIIWRENWSIHKI